ncbi:MAG: glutaminase [Pseudomonadota bacterium]
MRLDTFSHVDFQAELDAVADDIRPHLTKGKVASYIPALASQRADAFAIALTTLRGETFAAGEADTPFSIQSVSKVFSLVLALEMGGEDLWARVGREPSGSPFNSVVQLEKEEGRPRNPFINAGAIVVADTIISHCGASQGIDRLTDFIHTCAASKSIAVNAEVAASEAAYGDRNRALAYFMKSFGIVQNDVPEVLDTYFRQCALEMSVKQLARAGLFLAGGGEDPCAGRRITSHERVDRVNSIMMLCGHYDRSGEFAFRVGLAGKSGVGGGILAVIPDVGTVAVWSPGLNEAGNSLAGTLALEMLSDRVGLNLF